MTFPFHSAYRDHFGQPPVLAGHFKVLALAALCLGMGAALLFTVRRSWIPYRKGQLTRPALARHLA